MSSNYAQKIEIDNRLYVSLVGCGNVLRHPKTPSCSEYYLVKHEMGRTTSMRVIKKRKEKASRAQIYIILHSIGL